MSNVRPTSMNTTAGLSHVEEVCPRHRSRGRTCTASAKPGLKSRSARAVRPLAAGAPPALCQERATPSRSWSVPLVRQGIQNRAFVQVPRSMQAKIPSAGLRKLSRSCIRRCSSTAAVRHAVSQALPLQRSWCRQPRPHPSVEGTDKRLRLLSAPHLER